MVYLSYHSEEQEGIPMHILILSCNTGGGHNSAGRAVAEELRRRGHTADVVDFLALAGKKVSSYVSGTYIGMVKIAPAAFGCTYALGRAVSSAGHKLGLRSPVYFACARVIPGLEAYLREHPCDAIVAPHTFPALALTEMKRRGIRLPLTLAVATDYTCTPFFEEEACDYTVIPSEGCADDFVRRGIARETLLPFGIPVSAAFSMRRTREDALRALGLDPLCKLIVVMGGSMGAGHIGSLARSILELTGERVHLVIICGSNKRLRDSMSERYKNNSRVEVIGRTDKVALYMAACDVFYSKPGGITSTEAATMGVPLVHMTPIPGCEPHNRRLFVENGMSVSGAAAHSQAAAGVRLLFDAKLRESLVREQHRFIRGNAAEDIADFIENGAGLTV